MSKTSQVLTTKTTVDKDSGKVNTSEVWINADKPVDVEQHSIPNAVEINKLTDPWYILYWIDQYQTLPESVKQNVRDSISKPEYFRDFSESIAALLNIEFVKDNSVIPVSDIATNISAYTYSRVLDFILTQEQADLHEEMSIKVNNIFKLNMTYIKDDDRVASKLSTDAHGRNLITDSQHYKRMNDCLSDLQQLIDDKLGVMKDVLKFIQSNVSAVKFDAWRERIMTESTCVEVDMFGTNVFDSGSINRTQNFRENTRLDTQDIPVS